jgi:hypothetical protein
VLKVLNFLCIPFERLEFQAQAAGGRTASLLEIIDTKGAGIKGRLTTNG